MANTGCQSLEHSPKEVDRESSFFQQKECVTRHLYVNNISKDCKKDEIWSIFGKYGNIESIRFKVNKKVGPNALYAFITYSLCNEAKAAFEGLQSIEVRGRPLKIEYQKNQNQDLDHLSLLKQIPTKSTGKKPKGHNILNMSHWNKIPSFSEIKSMQDPEKLRFIHNDSYINSNVDKISEQKCKYEFILAKSDYSLSNCLKALLILRFYIAKKRPELMLNFNQLASDLIKPYNQDSYLN